MSRSFDIYIYIYAYIQVLVYGAFTFAAVKTRVAYLDRYVTGLHGTTGAM
jgi:hypothetical protein